MSLPRRQRIASRYLTTGAPTVTAHQGFATTEPPHSGPPNTLPAFRAALAAGADYLETDVYVTADDVVVIAHDRTLARLSQKSSAAIRDLTWQQLSEILIGDEQLTGTIPRLADVLSALPDTRVGIDVKTKDAVRPLAALLGSLEEAGEDVLQRLCIASFSDRRRRATLRLLPPGVCTSAGIAQVAGFWVCTRAPYRLATLVGRLALRGVDVLQVPHARGPFTMVDRRFVRVAHALRRRVQVWTINDAATMRQLLDMGVDGVITDRTDTAVAVLRQRTEKPR
ncbi:MAG: glycerophosphodiester phosphodiesterase [Micrococcales bacterium]|nr:MAG: glycerophosphodiester phosphodiesterase [Micrococcales bacterium]PIE27396.1 MAG: glycerophosphodiester phosphodiesterase [Micrococcales bacterium]